MTKENSEMCFICQGGTREELRQHLHAQIQRQAFALVPVGSGWEHAGWAYTLGLLDGRGHPELVVAGIRLADAVQVLDELARSVVQGTRFAAGESALLAGVQVGFVNVQARHIQRGLMDGWLDYYRAAGRWDVEIAALQVVLPDDEHCFEHQTSQPRLDGHLHVPFDGTDRRDRRAHLRRADDPPRNRPIALP